MPDTLIHVDDERAVDAWLANQVLAQASDDVLQRLWREGVESGDAGEIDFSKLKAEVRQAA